MTCEYNKINHIADPHTLTSVVVVSLIKFYSFTFIPKLEAELVVPELTTRVKIADGPYWQQIRPLNVFDNYVHMYVHIVFIIGNITLNLIQPCNERTRVI